MPARKLLFVFFFNNYILKIISKSVDLCVQCDALRLHPDDRVEHISVHNNNTCCAKPEHARHLVNYVSKVNDSSRSTNFYKDFFTFFTQCLISSILRIETIGISLTVAMLRMPATVIDEFKDICVVYKYHICC